MLTSFRQRRSHLQKEHDGDKLAYETARKQREAGPCPFDLALLQHEKTLQDKMFRSFEKLKAVVSFEQQAGVVSKNDIPKVVDSSTVTKRPCPSSPSSSLPLKKRRKRAAEATASLVQKEFFRRCQAILAAQSKPVLEECTSSSVWVAMAPRSSLFSHIKTTESANDNKPDPPGLQVEDSYDDSDGEEEAEEEETEEEEEEDNSVTTLSCADYEEDLEES